MGVKQGLKRIISGLHNRVVYMVNIGVIMG